MDLRALRTFRFGDTVVRRGTPVVMNETRSKQHAALGLVGKQDPAKPKPRKTKSDKEA